MSGLLVPEVRAAIEEALRRGLPVPALVTLPDGQIGRQAPPPPTPPCSLKEFMVEAWPVLEPSNPFIDNWHIDAICDHLSACTQHLQGQSGGISKLVVNVPPRCQKSLLVAVFWFCWSWTWLPETRWLYASYADVLSTRDSLKCRRLIQSPWFQRHFGSAFALTGDQNQKTRFENNRTGFRQATGVGGVGTGEGGDVIAVDDPHKVQEGESETVRSSTVEWWLETMSTRGNNLLRSVWLIIMQRVHEGDLTGAVLSRELGYSHLCLPMRYEAKRQVYLSGEIVEIDPKQTPTAIGFVDPRHADGELLWPSRFPPEAVDELEKNLGSYATAGQHQQRPAPRGGGMFQRQWFPIVPIAPAQADRVRYWDKAGTKDSPTAANTAGVLIARVKPGVYFVEDVVLGQWEAGERERMMKLTAQLDAQKYGVGDVEIWTEQEPGSGGKESADATIQNLAGFCVHKEAVTGDKVTRAEPFAVQAGAGNVFLVAGPWNAAYLSELEKFPKGNRKDQVDASSGAFNKLARKKRRVFG